MEEEEHMAPWFKNISFLFFLPFVLTLVITFHKTFQKNLMAQTVTSENNTFLSQVNELLSLDSPKIAVRDLVR